MYPHHIEHTFESQYSRLPRFRRDTRWSLGRTLSHGSAHEQPTKTRGPLLSSVAPGFDRHRDVACGVRRPFTTSISLTRRSVAVGSRSGDREEGAHKDKVLGSDRRRPLSSVSMFTRPDDLSDEAVMDALGTGWGLRVRRIEYVPLGFGSYHWRVDADDEQRVGLRSLMTSRSRVAMSSSSRSPTSRDDGTPDRSASQHACSSLATRRAFSACSSTTTDWSPQRTAGPSGWC